MKIWLGITFAVTVGLVFEWCMSLPPPRFTVETMQDHLLRSANPASLALFVGIGVLAGCAFLRRATAWSWRLLCFASGLPLLAALTVSYSFLTVAAREIRHPLEDTAPVVWISAANSNVGLSLIQTGFLLSIALCGATYRRRALPGSK